MRRAGRQHGNLIEHATAFAMWALSLPKPPTRQQVQGYLQCSGPTAARWRRAFLAALKDPHHYHAPGGKRSLSNKTEPQEQP